MGPERNDRVGLPGGAERAAGRPKVLVIAGFDPCGGAGVLADAKTLEAHGVYGYAVCTALTFQNERVVNRVEWLHEKDIFEQIDICFDARDVEMNGEGAGNGSGGGVSGDFEFVKMGITPSMQAARAIIRHLREHNPAIKVVMDPVIRSSSGKEFWTTIHAADFEEIASMVHVLTPNREEMAWLYPGQDVLASCRELTLSASAYLYLKGGHDPLNPGRDHLWSQGQMEVLEPLRDPGQVSPKHGSGCVLASALAAGLALGYEPCQAAVRAKRYTEQFLTSNTTLLGWHRPVY